MVGIGIVGVLGTAIWGGGLANQLGYKRNEKLVLHDFKDSGPILQDHLWSSDFFYISFYDLNERVSSFVALIRRQA